MCKEIDFPTLYDVFHFQGIDGSQFLEMNKQKVIFINNGVFKSGCWMLITRLREMMRVLEMRKVPKMPKIPKLTSAPTEIHSKSPLEHQIELEEKANRRAELMMKWNPAVFSSEENRRPRLRRPQGQILPMGAGGGGNWNPSHSEYSSTTTDFSSCINMNEGENWDDESSAASNNTTFVPPKKISTEDENWDDEDTPASRVTPLKKTGTDDWNSNMGFPNKPKTPPKSYEDDWDAEMPKNNKTSFKNTEEDWSWNSQAPKTTKTPSKNTQDDWESDSPPKVSNSSAKVKAKTLKFDYKPDNDWDVEDAIPSPAAPVQKKIQSKEINEIYSPEIVKTPEGMEKLVENELNINSISTSSGSTISKEKSDIPTTKESADSNKAEKCVLSTTIVQTTLDFEGDRISKDRITAADIVSKEPETKSGEIDEWEKDPLDEIKTKMDSPSFHPTPKKTVKANNGQCAITNPADDECEWEDANVGNVSSKTETKMDTSSDDDPWGLLSSPPPQKNAAQTKREDSVRKKNASDEWDCDNKSQSKAGASTKTDDPWGVDPVPTPANKNTAKPRAVSIAADEWENDKSGPDINVDEWGVKTTPQGSKQSRNSEPKIPVDDTDEWGDPITTTTTGTNTQPKVDKDWSLNPAPSVQKTSADFNQKAAAVEPMEDDWGFSGSTTTATKSVSSSVAATDDDWSWKPNPPTEKELNESGWGAISGANSMPLGERKRLSSESTGLLKSQLTAIEKNTPCKTSNSVEEPKNRKRKVETVDDWGLYPPGEGRNNSGDEDEEIDKAEPIPVEVAQKGTDPIDWPAFVGLEGYEKKDCTGVSLTHRFSLVVNDYKEIEPKIAWYSKGPKKIESVNDTTKVPVRKVIVEKDLKVAAPKLKKKVNPEWPMLKVELRNEIVKDEEEL